MQAELTPFQQTLNVLQQRVEYFRSQQRSAENVLTGNSPYSVRSLSQILPQLCSYSCHQTPLNHHLAEIYMGKDIQKAGYDDESIKYVLPPISQGEDSINEDDAFEPSFKWIANSIIDSSSLTIDHPEPKKTERGKVSQEWLNATTLLLFNVSQKIYFKEEMATVGEYLQNKFQKFPWIKYRRAKELYYKGKPSIMLRFLDEHSACFAYFNLSANSIKEFFGQEHQLFRVLENKIKEKIEKDVVLVFRRLPLSMTKESLLSVFRKGQGPTWVQELVEIEGYKYTLGKVNYLNDAFAVVAAFQLKNIKDAKVNYHPRSAKLWKQLENMVDV